MPHRVIIGVLLLVVSSAPAAAQVRQVRGPAQGWANLWIGRYMDTGVVADAESGTTWHFGEPWAFGGGYHRVLSPGLWIGLDVSYAAPRYEIRQAGIVRHQGTGGFLAPLASGRYGHGTGAGVGFYLAGSVGAFIYRIPDLDRWDADLALYGGSGIEYQQARRAFFLEWGRFWTYHQGDGVEANRVHHSPLRLGMRFGH